MNFVDTGRRRSRGRETGRRVVLFRERALEDIDALATEFGPGGSAGRCDNPRGAIRRALEFLRDSPEELGTEIPGLGPALAGVRVSSIPEFTAGVILYLATASTLEVVRVLHADRVRSFGRRGSPGGVWRARG